jgi:hypothetical protein
MTLLGRSQVTRSPASVQTAATQVFRVLRVGFTVLPIVFGLDKFANVLTDWPNLAPQIDDLVNYLAPQIDDLVPGTAHQAMLAVGVIEIVAGLVVAVLPRFGGPLVAVWLAGIIGNLLLIGGYADVALALSRLAWAFAAPAPSDAPAQRS